eukprot:6331650-Pyramimonas_sp.AAC.1
MGEVLELDEMFEIPLCDRGDGRNLRGELERHEDVHWPRQRAEHRGCDALAGLGGRHVRQRPAWGHRGPFKVIERRCDDGGCDDR